MSTTLTEARSVLLKLSSQFPAPSLYATQLAILSDYFDNQVPLLIENKNLTQRIAVLEASDPVPKKLPATRRGIECSAWIGIGSCKCAACQVSHA